MIENKEDFDKINEYRSALLVDGWAIEPIYKSEPVESAASFEKEGFHISLLSRDHEVMKQLYPHLKNTLPRKRYECSMSIWGPDGLAIIAPTTYNWEKIKAGARFCGKCGKEDVDTHRYSFAGRCCADCLPAMRKLHEQPGWDN